MKPSWLPDWTNPSNYPNPTHTAPLQWAWEFLRRNPEYQQLRAQLSKAPSKPAKILGFKSKFHIMATDLTRPPRPSENEPKELIFNMPFILYRGPSKSGVIHFDCTIDQNEMLVLFNLSWPIQRQLAVTKKALGQAAKDSRQSVKFRRRVEHYQTYLRLLDAKTAGADDNQIVSVLYPKLSSGYPPH